VDIHTETVAPPPPVHRVPAETEQHQVARLVARRCSRQDSAVGIALDQLREAVRATTGVMPVLLEAARAEATLGEMCQVMREELGDHREAASF
jgi:methylmalonyl-CoA mutase N-terminal domain/subunit